MTPTATRNESITWHKGQPLEVRTAASLGTPRAAAPTFPAQEPARDLRDYFQVLNTHRLLLGLSAGCGLLLGVVSSLTTTPTYKAHAAIQIQNTNSDFLSTKQINPISNETDPNSALTDVETQIKIISSEQLTDRVISRLHEQGKVSPLYDEVRNNSGFISRLRHKQLSGDELDYAARTLAAKHLTVKEIGPTRAVEITFSSPDRAFAALFTNTLVNEYSDYSMEDQRETSKHTVQWLTAQMEQTRKRLQDSAIAVQNYATSSGLLFVNQPSGPVGLGSDISGTKLQQVQAELSRAQDDRMSAQSHNDIAQSGTPEELSDALSDPRVTELHAKITDLERERAELLTTYTANNDKVRRVDAELVPLNTAYHSLVSALQRKVAADYQTALRREHLLTSTYKDEAAVVTDRANKSIQYNILKRDLDSNQQQYDSLLEQVKQANVASAVKVSPIRVYDPAKPPMRPASPNLPTDSAVGLAGGLMFGVITSLARARKVKLISRPNTLHPASQVRELGVIPRSTTKSRLGRSRTAHTNGGLELDLPANSNVHGPAVELVAWTNKEGVVAEAFRSLLTSVLFSESKNRKLTVLAFTSARPLEGKTTLICNLAISMAALGRRVLLIDGDLRKPRVHEIFDLVNEVGLSTILKSDDGLRQTEGAIQKTFVPNLSVLPSGPVDFAAGIILHGSVVGDLLNRLRGQYDSILIDTPPTLLTADARVLGNKSDGVVLVTRSNKTSSEDALNMTQLFKQDGTYVLGSIFNDYALPQRDYSYYGNTD